ncbi:TraI domain-containing protein [Aromatoleum buckelii]|nr:MobH family relaxase [Aromatoleum buckelii]MCK0513213.1 TraI domain-containing protein [Aromatoleum buckelii]
MIELAGACFLAAAALGGWLGWSIRRERVVQQRRADIDAKPANAGTPATGAAPGLAANRTGWLRVLDAPVLVHVCKLSNALQQIHRESKLSQAMWDRDVGPAILGYLQFVQLLPASEAHHHAHVGGLAAHTIEVIRAAVALRNGYLLPKGGAAEAIDAQRDHWTYAVILAALLHDIGKTMTDLRVSIAERPDGPGRPWLPVCGDMPTADAVEYEVRFAPKAERNYGAHRRLPLVLAPRIVPATALAFVAREPSVMRELEAAWSGDDATGVLAEIVRQADRHSAASNLQLGPRNQFATATAIPLVDQLMNAMRRLLRQGALPLNRDGAAGWIGAGAAWFVAKRLADTVREEIARADPTDGASIPGPAKNDRLFDSWQDYGLLERNPDTGQAIWYVEVRGEGYTHEFAMLKFPLAKLFDSVDDYPSDFDGELFVIPPRKTRGTRPDEPPGDRLGGAPKTCDAHPERQRASGLLTPPSPVPPRNPPMQPSSDPRVMSSRRAGRRTVRPRNMRCQARPQGSAETTNSSRMTIRRRLPVPRPEHAAACLRLPGPSPRSCPCLRRTPTAASRIMRRPARQPAASWRGCNRASQMVPSPTTKRARRSISYPRGWRWSPRGLSASLQRSTATTAMGWTLAQAHPTSRVSASSARSSRRTGTWSAPETRTFITSA